MSVTLAKLLERRTPIAWFESVAIVQGLCAAINDRGGHRGSVPDLRDIAITSEGHVEVLADGPSGQPAVHRAGRVLTALAEQQHMPVPLRLLALTAMSPEPRYASLHDLSAALDYFERPDRSKVVAEVYERYEQMPAPAAGVEVPPLPVLEEPRKPSSSAPARWKRSSLIGGIAAIVLLGTATAAWWLWQRPEGRWLRSGSEQVSRVVTAATGTVVSVAEGGVRAVKERLGATTPPPVPEVVVAAPASNTVRRPAPRQPVPLLRSRPVAGFGRDKSPVPSLLQAEDRDPWQAAAMSAPWADPFLVVAVSVEENGPVYTKADPSVVPPDLVRPRLPSFPPPGVRLEDLPRLEVLVSPTGDVESVKLLSAGAGVHPAMMLSAVKNWRFQPATLEGKPVRYRHTLWLTR